MNNKNLTNKEYVEYLKLVTEAFAKHGIEEGDDISELINNEDVRRIFIRSYLQKCTPNQAAVMIQLYWDGIKDWS